MFIYSSETKKRIARAQTKLARFSKKETVEVLPERDGAARCEHGIGRPLGRAMQLRMGRALQLLAALAACALKLVPEIGGPSSSGMGEPVSTVFAWEG